MAIACCSGLPAASCVSSSRPGSGAPRIATLTARPTRVTKSAHLICKELPPPSKSEVSSIANMPFPCTAAKPIDLGAHVVLEPIRAVRSLLGTSTSDGPRRKAGFGAPTCFDERVDAVPRFHALVWPEDDRRDRDGPRCMRQRRRQRSAGPVSRLEPHRRRRRCRPRRGFPRRLTRRSPRRERAGAGADGHYARHHHHPSRDSRRHVRRLGTSSRTSRPTPER